MSSRTLLFLTILALSISPRAASATLVTWGIQGTVTNVPAPGVGGGINVGDLLTGSVTYDTSIPPVIDNSYVRGYYGVTQLIIDVGTFHSTAIPGSQITLWGNQGEPQNVVEVRGDMPGTINGVGFIQFHIQLDTPTAPAMTPTLTEQPPILANFNSRVFNVFVNGTYSIDGVVTMIPEPTVLPLLVLLVPLARRRDCRRAGA